MSPLARWSVLWLGVATHLVASKTHGRQLRLERELAGYWEVAFGGQNPAWVEALWRRERLIYWGLAALVAVMTLAARALAPRLGRMPPLAGSGGERSWQGVVFLHVLVPLTGAFVAAGALSVARFVTALRGAATSPTPDWLSGALWGTAGWWALTLSMGTVLCVLAWRRPA